MNRGSRVRWMTLLLAAGFALAGVCRAQGTGSVSGDPELLTRKPKAPASTTADSLTSVPEDFSKVRLSPGVLLRFGVFDAPEMDATLRVAGDGTVTVPLAGSVAVGGLSVPEAQAKIRTALVAGEFFQAPQVNLDIVQLASGYVTLMGEVQTPGRFQLLAATPLRTVMALAGGETVEAGMDIEIQRQGAGEIEHVRMDRPHVLDTVIVAPGDAVTIPRAGVVYVLGAVKKPGGYLMVDRGSLDVLEALSLAGGTALEASLDTVRILRRQGDRVVEQTVKLSDFNTGKVPAPELGDKDIVYVTPSKLKSVFVNGANIVAAAASSLVYRVP